MWELLPESHIKINITLQTGAQLPMGPVLGAQLSRAQLSGAQSSGAQLSGAQSS